MITIKQIAQKAGVSPTTVSNVLNGNTSKVSAENTTKVKAILKEVNYVSNRGAIMLAHGVSHIIGVIFNYPRRDKTNIFQDPFQAQLVGSLVTEIKKTDYYMMLYTTESPSEVMKLAVTWKLDGLIIVGIQAEYCTEIRKSTSTPIVFIDCYFENDGQIYYNIGLEDENGAYKMTQYLIACGHTQVTFLADHKKLKGVDLMRLNGFKKALKQAGIVYTDRNFISLSINSVKRRNILENLYTHLYDYTALFFASDYYAAEAELFFQEKGLSIPDDISIAGFDNNVYSNITTPRITTMGQNVPEKGQKAVEMLMKILKHDKNVERSVILPVELVIRDSVKKLK
jgi:LacI family transcriptional regulator